MFQNKVKRNKEPLVYYDPMAQTNGSPVEDLPIEDIPVENIPVEDLPDGLEERLDAALNDSVNHPAHYTSGSIEVIDYIEDQKFPYHLGNAVKYLSRAGKKDPEKTIEDLRKAVWYINRYIQLLEKEQREGGAV